MYSPTWVRSFLASSDTEAQKFREALAELERYNSVVIGGMSVTCDGCWEVRPLREWTFIQNRYYTYPTGCTGGDYWSDCQIGNCHIQCPACSQQSYVCSRSDQAVLVEVLSRKDVSRAKIFTNPIIIIEKR